jgi:hypothetical protein
MNIEREIGNFLVYLDRESGSGSEYSGSGIRYWYRLQDTENYACLSLPVEVCQNPSQRE